MLILSGRWVSSGSKAITLEAPDFARGDEIYWAYEPAKNHARPIDIRE